MVMITTKTDLITKVEETGIALKSKLLEKEQLLNKGAVDGYAPLVGGKVPIEKVPVLNQDTTGTSGVAKNVVNEAAAGSLVELIHAVMASNDAFRVAVGSFTYVPGSTTASFSLGTDLTFNAGDQLAMRCAGATQDATLSDIFYSIKATPI